MNELIVIVGVICICLILTGAGMIMGYFAGVESGKQRMANICNVMERNAECPFWCASDGCMCLRNETW
jgi:hypothetical protein